MVIRGRCDSCGAAVVVTAPPHKIDHLVERTVRSHDAWNPGRDRHFHILGLHPVEDVTDCHAHALTGEEHT